MRPTTVSTGISQEEGTVTEINQRTMEAETVTTVGEVGDIVVVVEIAGPEMGKAMAGESGGWTASGSSINNHRRDRGTGNKENKYSRTFFARQNNCRASSSDSSSSVNSSTARIRAYYIRGVPMAALEGRTWP